MNTEPIVIIGAGPAGLMAAEQLAKKGFNVCVYEQNKAAARKFLVAGHGGFNLTHNEAIDSFVTKYDHPRIREMVRLFDNTATRQWLSAIGIETFVGSSGKIFPLKETKPIMVLQAWLKHLTELGVEIRYEHQLIDFNENSVTLKHKHNTFEQNYHRLILGLGGGSWAKTGSDAKWMDLFQSKNILTEPLQSANSGFNSPINTTALEGKYLKNIVVHFEEYAKNGEVVFTNYGLEGSPIYYMNRFVRAHQFPATLYVDLKPDTPLADVEAALRFKGKITDHLKKQLKIQPTGFALLKMLDKETYLDPQQLALNIKRYPIPITSFRPIDEVISTAGGVSFDALNPDLSLKNYPAVYCIGEMLNWEAPTGGYLLQACFSSGYWVANKLAI